MINNTALHLLYTPRKTWRKIIATTAFSLSASLATPTNADRALIQNSEFIERELSQFVIASEISNAISLMLHTDDDPTHGIANEYHSRYDHVVVVDFTSQAGNSVNSQILTSAKAAIKIGRLVITKNISPPGKDLVIKMALRKPNDWFINTFSVRYHWADVIAAVRDNAAATTLTSKGQVERIWLKYGQLSAESTTAGII